MQNAIDTSSQRRTRSRWIVAAPLAAAALGLLAAGCGTAATSGHTAGKPVSGYGSGAGSAAPTKAAPAVAAGNILVRRTSLGSVLTDRNGLTVYRFGGDMGATSSCSGACAAAWPPVTAAGDHPRVGAGANQSMLGVTKRGDGTLQLTYAGHPLYRFVGDRQPGDVSGQGLQHFGGVFDSLTATGQEVTTRG